MRGLRLGSDQAWAALAAPVEGTILSVIRAAADAADAATEGGAVGSSGPTAGRRRAGGVQAAELALAHTTEQLDDLLRAGVVDAGGQGLVLVLQALAEVVTGDAPSAPAARVRARRRRVQRESGSGEFALRGAVPARCSRGCRRSAPCGTRPHR